MYSLCNYCYSETNYNEPTLKKIDTAMKKNMGSMDRLIRVIIAILLVSLYFTNVITGTLGIVLISLSIIFVLTSLIGFCPLYTLFGIKTCKK
jgi:phosphoglycerol transferase MdoB-like AlkP superfamily enzyme